MSALSRFSSPGPFSMSSALNFPTLIAFAFGYLLGSIPFGLLLTRAAGLGDVRKIGSGNIGATNVLRTGNKGIAAATLFLDGFKGYLAVVLAAALVGPWLLGGSSLDLPAGGSGASLSELIDRLARIGVMMMAAGLGAYLGHIYPVWLGFKGGKGVATYIGVMLGIAPKVALAFCTIWLVVALVTRYSSLSALIGAAAAPVILWFLRQPEFAMFFALM